MLEKRAWQRCIGHHDWEGSFSFELKSREIKEAFNVIWVYVLSDNMTLLFSN